MGRSRRTRTARREQLVDKGEKRRDGGRGDRDDNASKAGRHSRGREDRLVHTVRSTWKGEMTLVKGRDDAGERAR